MIFYRLLYRVVIKRTHICLVHWLTRDCHCPVVITTWTGVGYESVYDSDALAEDADAENLWAYDDLQSTAPRVFAVDFTEYYDVFKGEGADSSDVTRNGSRYITIGEYTSLGDYEGPVLKDYHAWDEAKMTPQRLTGSARANLSEAQLSTYNVIRAVAEIECSGQFDSLNAYDNAVISAGPFHWTLAVIFDRETDEKDQVSEGELCAFLAYLRSEYPGAYEQFFGLNIFGLCPSEEWGENGEALFDPYQRKYTTTLEQRTSASDGTVELEKMPLQLESMTIEEAETEWLYFRNWHWFYRFVMASRTSVDFQEACWDFARLRLEDILTTEWDGGPDSWDDGTTIGDVFTSQKAQAMILRWHVYSPAQMISNNSQGDQLENALENAQTLGIDNPQVPQLDFRQCEQDTSDSELNWAQAPNWNQDPAAWDDRHECQLIRGIFQTADDIGGEDDQITINETIENIYRDQTQPLSESRTTH